MTGGVTWAEIPADIREKYKFRRRTDLPGSEQFGTPVQVKVDARAPGGGRVRNWIFNPTFPQAREEQDALLIPWARGEQRGPAYAEQVEAAPPIRLPSGDLNIPGGGSIDPPPSPEKPTTGTGSGEGGSGDDDEFEFGTAIAALAEGIFQRRERRGSTLPTRTQVPDQSASLAGIGGTTMLVFAAGAVGLAAYLAGSSSALPPARPSSRPREESGSQ
jgi:hypothetical protein